MSIPIRCPECRGGTLIIPLQIDFLKKTIKIDNNISGECMGCGYTLKNLRIIDGGIIFDEKKPLNGGRRG